MARETIDRDVNLSDRDAKRQLLTQLGPLQGLYAVDVKPIRPTRSNQANRYYFGVVCRAFREFLAAQGQHFTTEQVHELMKAKFLALTVHNADTGEIVGQTTERTAGMDTDRFSAYVNDCIDWLNDEFGIIVPEPDTFQLRQATA